MQKKPTRLLQIKNLSKCYPREAAAFFAPAQHDFVLKDVSFDLIAGESLAIVGESGSGKTTLGRCLIRLLSADSGQIFYKGQDLLQLSQKEFLPFRQEFQMIFQNPLQALNPRQRIRSCLAEPMKVFGRMTETALQTRIEFLLEQVGLSPELLSSLPAQLSGGQRQRVTIARALAMNPSLLIADEPTSSLDAAIKHQVVRLLQQLKENLDFTLLIITHDLGVVSAIADRIAVMHRGKIVELATTQEILYAPKHPYTRKLLAASRQIKIGQVSGV